MRGAPSGCWAADDALVDQWPWRIDGFQPGQLMGCVDSQLRRTGGALVAVLFLARRLSELCVSPMRRSGLW